MNREDSLTFVQERLRHHHAPSPLTRELGLRQRPRVTRRFVVDMCRGDHRRFERVDDTVLLRCDTGSVWITHDGDPKDVILSAGESYRAQREEAMHVFPLADCVLEIQFEDDVAIQ